MELVVRIYVLAVEHHHTLVLVSRDHLHAGNVLSVPVRQIEVHIEELIQRFRFRYETVFCRSISHYIECLYEPQIVIVSLFI